MSVLHIDPFTFLGDRNEITMLLMDVDTHIYSKIVECLNIPEEINNYIMKMIKIDHIKSVTSLMNYIYSPNTSTVIKDKFFTLLSGYNIISTSCELVPKTDNKILLPNANYVISDFRNQYISSLSIAQKLISLSNDQINKLFIILSNKNLLPLNWSEKITENEGDEYYRENLILSFISIVEINRRAIRLTAKHLLTFGINIYKTQNKNLISIWDILATNLTTFDLVFLGNWLGLSKSDINELTLSNIKLAYKKFFSDRITLIRIIDGLKTRYGSRSWLKKLSVMLGIKLGDETSIFNQEQSTSITPLFFQNQNRSSFKF